jgi:hypothetical protein
MKSRKPRRLSEVVSQSMPQKGTAVTSEAPGFLVRLVGKNRAKSLCREPEPVHRRRD